MVTVNRDEYQRVQTQKEKVVTPLNEIRVLARHSLSPFIAYGIGVLNGEEGKTKDDTIIISGMGGAIYTAVNVAEIIKHRVVGLHQITEISSEEVTDVFEPIDKNAGKDNLSVKRRVSTIRITLSRKSLDTTNPGYQPPVPEDQVHEQEKRPQQRRRSARNTRPVHADPKKANEVPMRSEVKQRGNRQSRGGRGGRGGRGFNRGREGAPAGANRN